MSLFLSSSAFEMMFCMGMSGKAGLSKRDEADHVCDARGKYPNNGTRTAHAPRHYQRRDADELRGLVTHVAFYAVAVAALTPAGRRRTPWVNPER